MKQDCPQHQLSKQPPEDVSAVLASRLTHFLAPLTTQLDAQMDKRLVRTFAQLVCVIVQFRHSQFGLLLSELGGFLLTPAQAPAGTKRISNLLRSKRWHAGIIDRFLWQQGDRAVTDLESTGEDALCLWDESVIEKAESIALEGLCAVRSSVAARLKRIKPGYYNPPSGRPIHVPGMNWAMVMITGRRTAPAVAAGRWWSTRGTGKSNKRTEEAALLKVCFRRWESVSSTFGTVALRGDLGLVWRLGISFVLSCAGRKNTRCGLPVKSLSTLGS